MLRRILGFAVGFCGTLALIFAILVALDAPPRPGHLIMLVAVAVGTLTSRLFIDPQGAASAVSLKFQPVREKWWRLEVGLRLCLVVGLIWAIGAYVLQIDRWQPDLKLVFVPPVALIALYFAYQKLVRGQQNSRDDGLH